MTPPRPRRRRPGDPPPTASEILADVIVPPIAPIDMGRIAAPDAAPAPEAPRRRLSVTGPTADEITVTREPAAPAAEPRYTPDAAMAALMAAQDAEDERLADEAARMTPEARRRWADGTAPDPATAATMAEQDAEDERLARVAEGMAPEDLRRWADSGAASPEARTAAEIRDDLDLVERMGARPGDAPVRASVDVPLDRTIGGAAVSPDAEVARALAAEPDPRAAALDRAFAANAGPEVSLPGSPPPAAAPSTSAPSGPRSPMDAFADLVGGTAEGYGINPSAPASAPRRAGGGAPRRAPAVAPDPNDLLIEALTNRPEDAPSLVPYDSRTETPLERDLRLNAEGGNIEVQRAELAAQGYAMERDRIEAEDRARREYEAERRTAMSAAQRSYRTFADRAASLRIDPDGFYHSRGVGGTIASAIAIGLGALGAATNGGPNVALQMINEEIDRDIQAQQQRIESAFRRADAEGTLYDMARQEYADRSAALDASRALALENVAAQVGEASASLGSVEARHSAEVMAAQLRDQAAAAAAEAERAEYEWQLQMASAEARLRRDQARAMREERRLMGGTGGPSYEEPTEARMNEVNRLIDSNMEPEAAAAAVGIDPALVRGGRRFAETSAGASSALIGALSGAVDRVADVVDANVADIPAVGIFDSRTPALSDAARTMRQDLLALANAYGRVQSGGAITDEELDLFRGILFGSGTEAELRHGIEIVRGEVGARTSPERHATSYGDDLARALEGVEGASVIED